MLGGVKSMKKRFKFYEGQYGTETKEEYFDRLLMQNIIEADINAPSELWTSFVEWAILLGFFLVVGFILAMIF